MENGHKTSDTNLTCRIEAFFLNKAFRRNIPDVASANDSELFREIHDNTIIVCSNCRMDLKGIGPIDTSYIEHDDGTFDVSVKDVRFAYCPYCGARIVQ